MSDAPESSPLATVVITTHNRDELAQRALSSALAQTLSEVEVVVVARAVAMAWMSAVPSEERKLIWLTLPMAV